jgi:hypothetical protein
MPVAQGFLFDVYPAGDRDAMKASQKTTAVGGGTMHARVHVGTKWGNGAGRTVRTDIYTELYLWNKNVDSLLRVLQRLEAFRILPGQTLTEWEIRFEELRSAFNVRLLETMFTREQTDHWRFSRLREALDDASRNERVQ